MNYAYRIANLLKKTVIALPLLFCTTALHAEWNPEECMPELDQHAFSALDYAGYKTMKTQVTDALKGSWCSAEKIDLLMDLVLLTRPNICVEIGAFTGSSILPVAATLKHLNNGKVFAIDAWSNEVAVRNLSSEDPNRAWWSTVKMSDVQKLYDQMIKTWHLTKFCSTIQDTSEKAVHRLPEIDFLHIDGDYSEKGSLQDVELYLPKVKSGGYILLSNLFIIVNNTQPKLKAFCALFDECEMVCEIERDNAVLFKKI